MHSTSQRARLRSPSLIGAWPSCTRTGAESAPQAAGEAALLLLTDAGGATGDEGRQAWLQFHPARASGGEIVGDGGGETREKCEMRRGKRTREKIRVVRGAACGPADLSRSWIGTDDGNEGRREPSCARRFARPGRLDLLVFISLITSSFSLMMIAPSKV